MGRGVGGGRKNVPFGLELVGETLGQRTAARQEASWGEQRKSEDRRSLGFHWNGGKHVDAVMCRCVGMDMLCNVRKPLDVDHDVIEGLLPLRHRPTLVARHLADGQSERQLPSQRQRRC